MTVPIKPLVLFLTATRKKFHWFFYRMLPVSWWVAVVNMQVLLKMELSW